MKTHRALPLKDLDAVLLDLDGVITDTASLHAKAWKEMFDSFLELYEGQAPFDIRHDYLTYVDGKPRYEGARSFLKSRRIEIPFGDPGDEPEKRTICGLGNRKNQVFHRLIDEHNVEAYPGAVAFIKALREQEIKTAMVTSSKNGRAILEAAGIAGMIDVVVDGNDAARQKIEGKPAPDIFLHAAAQLGAEPERTAVVEDAQAGVEAGKRGDFGWVVGVARQGDEKALSSRGADIVVTDLRQLLSDRSRAAPHEKEGLPSAMDAVEQIGKACSAEQLAVFLDFDGTLTPIVERPEDAHLDPEMRRVVKKLARYCTVGIISGRDRKDVQQRVDLPGLYYAGSHGFDIVGPDGRQLGPQLGEDYLPLIEAAEHRLQDALAAVAGAQIERKKFSIAVHYRRVDRKDVETVQKILDRVFADIDGLRRSSGKKVYELQPDVDWHKGRAVRYLLDEAMKLSRDETTVVYIGDDTTDEDAFREISDSGMGIVVDAEGRRSSAASYRLKDPEEVRRFLEKLVGAREQTQSKSSWQLRYSGFDPSAEKLREALTTLGNGYFCTRGASCMATAGKIHYPGTYLAGGYNRLKTEIAGHIIENEDLVNLPNWLPVMFRIEGGPWLEPDKLEMLSYEQVLDIRQGVLHRSFTFRDDAMRVTSVAERRLVHMEHPHLAALELTLTAKNWSGRLELCSAIDGGVVNDGVPRYRGLNNRHLRQPETQQVDDDTLLLTTRTNQSDLGIAMAARTRLFRGKAVKKVSRRVLYEPYRIGHLCELDIYEEEPVRVEKIVSLYTSRDAAISEPALEARQAAAEADTFASLHHSHTCAWRYLWRRFSLDLEHNAQEKDLPHSAIAMIVHLYTFHLLQTTSINIMRLGLDVGVPSRGWHGEAYRGHVFWDELFIFPMINLRMPEITKSLLMYRYRRLPAARQAARREGYHGAMYPWQSGSNGREESQQLHLNPRSGRWLPDNSRLQRHVNIAIAYNLYHYYQVTKDMEFMAFYGAEMMLEIARFWSSLARYNAALDRYEISGVMGPDEYHDGYPDTEPAGLNNNAYTNIMAVWVLLRTQEVLNDLPVDIREQWCEDLELTSEELNRWEDICSKMRVVFHDGGIISQFEGYADLEEFDWQGYQEKYDNIQRLDRILEKEGKDPNRYKASKQADVLMLFYLLSAEELSEIFEKLGYPFSRRTIPDNISYYVKRTSHGSTLSNVVHAWVLSRSDRVQSWKLFGKALQSDIVDIQGGTTPEGIHLGAMAGTVDQLQRGYTGIVTRGDVLWLNPCLPRELKCLRLNLRYRSHFLEVTIDHHRLEVAAVRSAERPIQIGFDDKVHELQPNRTLTFDLDNPAYKEEA